MYNPHKDLKTRFLQSFARNLKMFFLLPGPNVSLSSAVVDFGCVEEGGERVHRVELRNSSPAEAIYQWDLDCNGHSVFQIHPVCGIVRPHSQTSLKAVYKPTGPTAHHRRVPCLILHAVGDNTKTSSSPYGFSLFQGSPANHCFPFYPIFCVFHSDTNYLHVLL